MGAADKLSTVSRRLKREDYHRTKHDPAFSQWKILIGPSDWEDHLLNKDGAEKYRIHNLPNSSSCPGLYELGVATSCPRTGREFEKLKSDFIIPVYLGQAKNVRTRLQRYGRQGAHLENGFLDTELNDSQGQGLFTEIFSRGFPIVYRWAPMKSKKDAEETEAQLLDTFDYAWNRGSNGARRPDDIYQILDSNTSSIAWSHPIVKKFQILLKKKVGLKIKACENESSFNANHQRNNVFSRILKFGRSRPMLVSDRLEVHKDSSNICGVALGQGYVCTMSPVEGRMRCSEHKGMKVNGSTSKINVKSQTVGVGRTPIIASDSVNLNFQEDCPVIEHWTSTCGVALHDGSFCTRKPVQGRKRCEEHKGRKKFGSISKPIKKEKDYVPSLEPRSPSDNSELTFVSTLKLPLSSCSERSSVNMDYVIGEEPVVMENVPRISDNSFTCGAQTLNGSSCKRKPGKGSKRCWQHQGKRAERSAKVSACN